MIKIFLESDKCSHIAGVTLHATNILARKSQYVLYFYKQYSFRTAYPAEQNDQPLQRPFSLYCGACGRNGHKASESFRSSYGNSSWVNQRFNNNSCNYNNDNFPNRRYNNFYSQRVERQWNGNKHIPTTSHPWWL